MSHIDHLRTIADARLVIAMDLGERYARQHDVVANLRQRLAFAEASLAELARDSEEAELAHREAARDVELAVDSALDEECGCSSAPTRCATCATIERLRPGSL